LADAISMPTRPYADMTFGMGRDGFPAICMTQLAAKVYCKWLSAKTGRYYRLPTEAEWEYACRAGTKTAYSFGDDPEQLEQYAWYFDNGDDRYHKVGEKKPNPWGLHDMHGNIAEWVLDQYTADGYSPPASLPAKNPVTVPTTIYPRVVRGGSWLDDPERLRSAARQGSTDEWKEQDPQIPQSIWYYTDATFIGFRVVRPLRQPTPEEAAVYDIDKVQRVDMVEYIELKGAGE
jgi:formylglycine-generating enzyme required for sulfatase activity